MEFFRNSSPVLPRSGFQGQHLGHSLKLPGSCIYLQNRGDNTGHETCDLSIYRRSLFTGKPSKQGIYTSRHVQKNNHLFFILLHVFNRGDRDADTTLMATDTQPRTIIVDVVVVCRPRERVTSPKDECGAQSVISGTQSQGFRG
jgi:hypothetical protein